jgi:hypothetical protein
MVLAGSKSDLRDDPVMVDNLRQRGFHAPFTDEEGQTLAKDIGAYDYVPYSSLTQHNLARLFDTAIEAAFDANPLLSLKKKSYKSSCVLQ